jgi:hypothetical protein
METCICLCCGKIYIPYAGDETYMCPECAKEPLGDIKDPAKLCFACGKPACDKHPDWPDLCLECTAEMEQNIAKLPKRGEVPRHVCSKCGIPTRLNYRGSWVCIDHLPDES